MIKCRDCRHFFPHDALKRCGHDRSMTVNAIGDAACSRAEDMRKGVCGISATLFEQIPERRTTWPYILVALILLAFAIAGLTSIIH